MTDAHDLADGDHREPFGVGGADGLVAVFPQRLGLLLEGGFTSGVLLGEGRQAGSCLWGSALSSGYVRIV
jgi:hypothetical protein